VIRVAFSTPPGASSPVRPPKGLQEAMETAASTAVVELLAAYGVTIKPTASGTSPPAGAGLAALGLVSFTASGLSGTATLGASAAILKRTNAGNAPGRDWVAELANQFIGRFKLKLLRGGFELWSLAPVAVKGRLLVTGISQPESPPLSFVDTQGGAVSLWMDVDVTGEIKNKNAENDAEIPREGDVILF
jgi:hypothetical protein